MVGYIMEMENLCIFKLMAAGPAMELPTFLAEAGAGGCVGGRGGIIYPRFIVKLLTASERSGPRSHMASSGQMLNIARLCSII